jgi:hypothetical protein
MHRAQGTGLVVSQRKVVIPAFRYIATRPALYARDISVTAIIRALLAIGLDTESIWFTQPGPRASSSVVSPNGLSDAIPRISAISSTPRS